MMVSAENGTCRATTRQAIDDAITRHNDDRITRFGKVLRRSRIDELPQIINILRGEMSWIGPRPEASSCPHGTIANSRSIATGTSCGLG